MPNQCDTMQDRMAEAALKGTTSLPDDLVRHLEACSACRDFAEKLRVDDERLAEYVESAEASMARVEANVQRALQDMADTSKVTPRSRWEGIMFKRSFRVAAAVVLLAAAISAIGYMAGHFGGATPAWADVVEEIKKAVSVAYVETYEFGDAEPFSVDMAVRDDGRIRSVRDNGNTSVYDYGNGVTVALYPHNKTALIRTRIGRKLRQGLFNYLDWMKTLHEDSGEFVGTEELDGVKTNVFEVKEDRFETHKVWVNVTTGLPYRIESTTTPADTTVVVPSLVLDLRDFGGEESVMRSIMLSNNMGVTVKGRVTKFRFHWNLVLDDSLFSLTPPADYKVEERELDVSSDGATDLARALETWVDLSGGALPGAIGDLGSQQTVPAMLKARYDKDGVPEDELEAALATAHVLLKGLMFAQQVKLWGTWGYCGDTAEVGNPRSIICWWSPEDSDDYRAILGDFRVGAVTAEDVEVGHSGD